nr:hypothetical protein [Methylobacterium sp. Leaf122]
MKAAAAADPAAATAAACICRHAGQDHGGKGRGCNEESFHDIVSWRQDNMRDELSSIQPA